MKCFKRVSLPAVLFCSLIIFLISLAGVRLSPLGKSATTWPIVRTPDDR
jgi:hypothetical protein